jgi:hypothetical protein
MLTFSSNEDDRIVQGTPGDSLDETLQAQADARREVASRHATLNAPRALRRARGRQGSRLRAAAPGLARLSVVAVWIWSMVELPAELTIDASIVQTFALAMSKLCLTALVGMVLMGNAIARKIFLLVCWLSILAIAPDLPLQFHYDRTGFLLSAIECLMKALAIIAFALPGLDYKVALGDRAGFDTGR